MTSKIITRFAPSPTGYLHIGSARTALFNYVYAKANNGIFYLRIEDTDLKRSNQESIDAIYNGLKWLGLDWQDPVLFQSTRNDIYRNAALELVKLGKAYYCFSSQEEIQEQRLYAMENKQSFLFNSPWRDKNEIPTGDKSAVIRLKAPKTGTTDFYDNVQGQISIQNDHLDDMVLLRSDGTATYMLAVVVDDHEMNITHIIRGDDHLSNTSRQILIYKAFGWDVPNMTHIPLIHGDEGAKLSKRHGALGVEEYKKMGYLPETLLTIC